MPFQATFGNGSLRTFGLGATKRKIGANVAVQYLVLAGGGGGFAGGTNGAYDCYGSSGGGGAGGLKTGTVNTSGGQRLQIIVGAGGGGWTSGSNSSVTSMTEGVWNGIVSDGGGRGGVARFQGTSYPAQSGGSGGGGEGFPQWNGLVSNNGLGYSPQGNNGGGAGANSIDRFAGGGGGGAGGAGGDARLEWAGGHAGAALASSITGTPVNYAGGGASTGSQGDGTQAAPGAAARSSAPANGGGGSGGVGPNLGPGAATAGGSGVVIIRSSARASNTVGSPTETQVSGEWVYRFTGSGEVVIGTV